MKSGEYSELQAFIAVAENGSFSRASKVLRITPSALSQVIKRFENRLGVQVFNRTTRSVQLTESGAELYSRVSPAFSDLHNALLEAKAKSGNPCGTVKIHTTSMAAESILSPIVGDFCTQYPDIHLDITVEDRLVDLTVEGYDLGICLGEFLHNDMVAYPLGGPLKMAVAATEEYLSNNGMPLTPNDLLQHKCINWRHMEQQNVYRWEFYVDKRWVSYNVNGPLTTTSRELALQAALKGAVITFWTEDKLRPYFLTGQLIQILEQYCPPFDGWHLYYFRKRHMPEYLRFFVDYLKERYPTI